MIKEILTFGAGAAAGFFSGKHFGNVIRGFPGPLKTEFPKPLPVVKAVTKGDVAKIFMTGDELGLSPSVKIPLYLQKNAAKVHRETQILSCQRRIEYWLQPGIMSHLQYVGGMNWYRSAHAWCAQLAASYDVSIDDAVDVTSAVSPGTPWDTNQVVAELVVHNFMLMQELASRAEVEFDGSPFDNPYAKAEEGPAGVVWWIDQDLTYPIRWGQNIKKAWNILAGRTTIKGKDPGARKRENFSANIRYPSDPDPVTVDMWAWRAAIGIETNEDKSTLDLYFQKKEDREKNPPPFPDMRPKFPGSSAYVYNLYEEAYRRSAKRRGLLGHQVQAIVWVVIRTALEPGVAARDPDAQDLFFEELEEALGTEGADVVKALFEKNFGLYTGEINY